MSHQATGFLNTIDGALKVVDRFGYWPSFHDAEILRIELTRNGLSTVEVYCYEGSRQKGQGSEFVITKDAIILFLIEGISDLKLEGFSHQNVIFDFVITVVPDGFRLELEDTFGIGGYLECANLKVDLKEATDVPRS